MKAIRYTAAGGVVVYRDQVLVLRRPSRDEVRLPKGHIKRGESAREAALREVTEESGYADLEAVADLGQQTVEFEYKGAHIVRDEQYFLMHLRSPQQVEREEVEHQFNPDWLPWEQALSEMTYRAEREWVKRAQSASLSRQVKVESTVNPQPRTWRRYQELRPDELATLVEQTPIAFWPLGLLEHHGWHLPVGLDGLKAEHTCVRVAERTGGIVLPTMWWGAGGGHGDFMWTMYQPPEAAEAILVRTLDRLIAFGFRVIVLLAGHYPWQQILDRHLPALRAAHREVLFLWGTEMNIADPVQLPGDHAAREETSYGLALFPQWVDVDALRPGRDASAWPGGQAPRPETWHPGVCFDPGDPLFAQMGEDARLGSAERGEAAIERLVAHLADQIDAHLR